MICHAVAFFMQSGKISSPTSCKNSPTHWLAQPWMSCKQYTQQKKPIVMFLLITLWSVCTSTLETQQGGHCGLFVQLVQTTQCSDLKTRSISDHDDSCISYTKPGWVSSHIRSLVNLGSQHLRRTWDAKVSWSRTLQGGPRASFSLAYLLLRKFMISRSHTLDATDISTCFY